MDCRMHIAIATTLSMIITFMLYCTLKDTRASDSLFQNIVADRIRDQLLHRRCLWNRSISMFLEEQHSTSLVNETCEYFLISEDKYNIIILALLLNIVMNMSVFICFNLQNRCIYVRPIIATIICGWLIARLLDGVNLCYNMDMISVYFLIWQVMFAITRWELKQLTAFSPTFNRGWICVSMAFGAFTAYDAVVRYLPAKLSYMFFWTISFGDIYLCLHPKGRLYKINSFEDALKTDLQVPIGVYSTWDLDDSEMDEDTDEISLGHGDFHLYNLMLLLILPPLSSMTTQVLVTIGYIIIVQISCQITVGLTRYYQTNLPGVPIPVALVSMYAIILDIFVEY